MRGIMVLILALMCFGCAQPEAQDNVTDVTNVTDITNQTNATAPECAGPVCGSDGMTYSTDCEAIAANVSFASGECVEENCTDSDGGIETKTAGRAQKGGQASDDYCPDNSTLVEFSCLGKDLINTTVSCEHGCGGGRCLDAPPAPEKGCKGPVQADLMKAETVTMDGVESTDYCIDFKTVKDYYCKDNQMRAQNAECPAGYRCDQGACVEIIPECSETDLGADIFTRGRTTVSHGLSIPFNEWDECDDQGTIIEHSCSVDGAKTEYLECGSGYMCSGGRCIESDCEETDDGFDIYKRGETSVDDEEEKDDCLDRHELREFYCYGNDIKSDDVMCPEDYICDRDRCVEGSVSE